MRFKKFIKESFEDMDRRCPECNTLLNDGGTCPKCDDGEEDYGDELSNKIEEQTTMLENLSPSWEEIIRRLKKDGYSITGVDTKNSYIELEKNNKEYLCKYKEDSKDHFIASDPTLKEKELSYRKDESMTKSSNKFESMNNKEKLMRAFPGVFNFDKTKIEESVQKEDLSNREKLLRAFPELDFSKTQLEGREVTHKKTIRAKNESIRDIKKLDIKNKRCDGTSCFDSSKSAVIEDYEEYDDDFTIDDVEEDRRHAALYGGDLTYCKDCGTRLKRNEWGGYCPECNPEEI